MSQGGKDTTGPIFISGRQHSGNTMTAVIFSMVPDCFVVNVEGWFFEHRGIVDKIKDPTRRAQYIVDILRLEDADLAERTRVWLADWHRQHPQASSIDVYRQAMRFATTSSGKRFWVRRATSYIFYAQDILTLMPEARLLYLLRNPYDKCASLKRRNPRLDRFGAMVIGWNKGLRIASKLQEAHPDRIRIVRYEDMVTKPVETFREVFDFVGVPFREQYLEIPHVNRSEAHQIRTSETRGINKSRVYYYVDVLRPSEIAALDLLVSRQKIREMYPDLPPRREAGWGRWLGALGWLVLSPYRYAASQVRRLVQQSPRWRARRFVWRVASLFRS